MVAGEAQVPVVGVPEELRGIEQHTVGLLGVEAELEAAAHEHVAPDESVRTVDAEHDVLGVTLRLCLRPGPLVVLAGVDHDVLGLRAAALDLEVAANALAK